MYEIRLNPAKLFQTIKLILLKMELKGNKQIKKNWKL
jgi:hypothetical protein